MEKYKDSYVYDLQRLYKVQVKDKVYAYYITHEAVTVDYNPFSFDRKVFAHGYPIPNFTRDPETGDILTPISFAIRLNHFLASFIRELIIALSILCMLYYLTNN